MASSSSSSPEIAAAAPVVETHTRFSYKDATQEEVLEDLSSRFILNLPDEELGSLERVCFQVEQAHWFYEDFIREENTKLPSMALKRFSEMLFHACPLLQQWSHDHEEAFKNFMQYKTRVPVCGAIMLNDAMDHVVLVKGWKASSNWGFPKGKINETEPPYLCAIREVLEETGYNLAGQLDPANVIEMSIKEQKISLFIVPGVPEDFEFQTRTRKEISQISWFKLSDLPTWKRSKIQPPNKKFYLISPFIGPLKNFINERRPRNGRKPVKPKRMQNGQPVHLPSTGPVVVNGGQQESKSQDNHDTYSHPTHQADTILKPRTDVNAADIQSNPELARIFGFLSLQGTAAPSQAAQANGHSTNTNGTSLEANAATSVSNQQSDASDDSPVPTRATEQTDWSSAVPPHYSQPSNPHPSNSQPSNSQPSTSTATPVTAPTSSPATSISLPPLRSQTSRVSLNGVGPTPSQIPSQPKPATPSLSPSATSPRRTSATADISPYLSRATTETPISTKTLQHLQLLESVANESARLAPMIAIRSAMASRGPVPDGYYPPPSSVPPQLPPPNARDLGVLYNSTHPGVTSSAAGYRMPIENPAYTGYGDPFNVRSRTSQAYHRPPMHNPTGSVSMNQNHLLSVINGSRGGPISPGYPMNPQFMQHQQQQVLPPMYNAGPSPYALPLGPGSVPYMPPAPVMHGYAPAPNPLAPPSGILPPHLHQQVVMPNANLPPGMPMSMGMAPPGPPPSHSNPSSLLALLTGRPPTQTAATPAQVHQ